MKRGLFQTDDFGFWKADALDTPVLGYIVKTTWRALLLSHHFVLHAKMVEALKIGERWGGAIMQAQYELERAANKADREYWAAERKRLRDGFVASVKLVEAERDRLGALERSCKAKG
jgi:hypothetical protein